MDLNKRIDFEANLNVSPVQIDHLMAKGGLISEIIFIFVQSQKKPS